MFLHSLASCRAKGTSALERYGRHDLLMNRWDAFLLKLDGAD